MRGAGTMQENHNDQNRLITPWGYIGYALLFSIPLVGLICMLVFAFSSSYPCRRNFARAYLIILIIVIVIALILLATGFNYSKFFHDFTYRYNYYY